MWREKVVDITSAAGKMISGKKEKVNNLYRTAIDDAIACNTAITENAEERLERAVAKVAGMMRRIASRTEGAEDPLTTADP